MQESHGAPVRPGPRWRLLHEPLVQFFIAGLILFATYRALHPESGGRYRIELTPDDLAQMSVAVLAQERPAPDAREMASLIEQKVREEVLYREAVAMGFDQGDEIVKRRMAQKMEFLAEDLSDLREPTQPELRAWFREHPDQFMVPGRITFRHIYFSPDSRGTHALADAAAAERRLAGKPAEWPGAQREGDQFMFQDRYADRSPEQVAAVFGGGFAKAIFQATPGSWQGPVESGLGYHLVVVEELRPPSVPAFEEVMPDVKVAWIDAQREEYKKKSYAEMRAKYKVVLPPGVSDSMTVPSGVTPRGLGF
jgi:peptidyl-prolyl cis-trans isomerase C